MRELSVDELCQNVHRPIKGTFRIYKTKPKTSVEQSVTEMIEEAKQQKCMIVSEFKGIPIMVDEQSTVSGIVKSYECESKARLAENKEMRKFVINLKQTYLMNLSMGTDIYTATDNMIKVAQALNGIVFAKFNSVPFAVNQHSTLDGVINGFRTEVSERTEAYKNSPEGQKRALEEKRREIEDYKLGIQVDELIKNEELSITSPIHFNKLKTNAEKEGLSAIVDVANRWGRLMQIEMKNQNTNKLTQKMVASTYKMATAGKSDYNLSGSMYGFVRNMLIVCWDKGRDLAQIERFNMTEVDTVRHEVQSAEKNIKTPIKTNNYTR